LNLKQFQFSSFSTALGGTMNTKKKKMPVLSPDFLRQSPDAAATLLQRGKVPARTPDN
jgi:hypothetical protein